MPQHIWRETRHMRVCETCHVKQFNSTGKWQPEVYPICPGDDDDHDDRGYGPHRCLNSRGRLETVI
jgi:hypothetical protein